MSAIAHGHVTKAMFPLADIMIAPNGARLTKDKHPGVPISVDEIIAEAQACYAAGARAIHAHVRDQEGKHVLDAALYKEMAQRMAATLPNMHCQISTEAVGRYTPAQQMALVKDVHPTYVSVGLRELSSDGWTQNVEAFYHWCAAKGVVVQHILYDARDFQMLLDLMDQAKIPAENMHLLFVLGRYSKDLQSHPDDLQPFLALLKSSMRVFDWAVCAFGSKETHILVEAIQHGGKARIGFENNVLNADGSLASSTAERVQDLVAHIDAAKA